MEDRQSAPGEEWKNQTADAERLKRLEETLNRLETKVSQTSRFDWKWLISLLVPLVAAGIVGYFGLKADLKVVQNSIQTIQSDIQRMEGDIKEVKKDVKQLQIDQTKLTGEVQLANQKLSTIEKTVEKIQNSRR